MAKHIDFDTAYSAVDDLNPWRPGTRQAPYASAGALILSIVGVLISAIILAVSDGKTLESWDGAATFTPATYLSIASTITNITLHYALMGGITVSWWRRALLPNTHVADLHRTWSYGNNFFAALTSLRNFDVIALASILVTLAPINGPLLQRASRVTSIVVSSNETIAVNIAARLPDNYTAYLSGRRNVPALFTTQFATVVRSYYNRDNIPSNSTCQGTCNTHVLGAGWAINCDSSLVFYNMSEGLTEYSNGQIAWTQVFDSNFQWSADLPVIVQTGASYKSNGNCTGNLNIRNCTLVAATVKYPVQIGSGSIALDPSTTIWDDVVVGPIVDGSFEEGSETSSFGHSTYGGLSYALSSRFQSSMLMVWNGPPGWEITSYGEGASAYAVNPSTQPGCETTFSDPMDDMLAGARELMFRSAVDAGMRDDTGNSTEYVAAVVSASHNIYRSNYLYFGIATGLSVLSIFGVVGTFNGFWLLGRSVTLSPIETAKAFNPPILSNNDSNATIRNLLEEVGTKPIRYGCVGIAEVPEKSNGHLSPVNSTLRKRNLPNRTEDSHEISRPTDLGDSKLPNGTVQVNNHDPDNLSQDLRFEQGLPSEMPVQDDEQPLLRLQLADPKFVEAPRRGGKYTGYNHQRTIPVR